MAFVLPLRGSITRLTIGLNAAVLACYVLLTYAGSLRGRLFLSVMRDWFPLALLLLAYREMGWFAPAHHAPHLEYGWIAWDHLLLRQLGLHRALEVLGPLLPSLLEVAYALVYTLGPFSMAMLYVYGRRERAPRFLFTFVLGVLLCYAQFPFWPSEPPRTVFPGQDFPSYSTIFRQFNWWMLGGYGIHTSVFPSAHVGGAFSAAFGMWLTLPERVWVALFLLVMAVLIATATVYGRYHYFADALAGFAMSLVALALSRVGRRNA